MRALRNASIMRGDIFLPDLSGASTSEEFQRMIKKTFCLYKVDSEEYYASNIVVCVSSDKSKLEARIKQEEAKYEAALKKYCLNEQVKKDLKEIAETLPKNHIEMPAPLRKVKNNMTNEEHKQYKKEKDAHALLMREYSDSVGNDFARRLEEACLLYCYQMNTLLCAENGLSVESLKEISCRFNQKPEKYNFEIEEVEEI